MSSPTAALLDAQQLQDLYQRASQHAFHAQVLAQQSPQAGDMLAQQRGMGMEYAESRPYSAGDEPRLMHWRLTARQGKLFVKQFQDEQRPSLFILVDRRNAMRFGTRRYLKVTQAARVAALLAFSAAQQGWEVSGVLLEQQVHWLPPSQGQTAIWQWVQQCCHACPLTDVPRESQLAPVLTQLHGQLRLGAQVYLLSDFADLNPQCEPALLQLNSAHALHAVHILDRSEHHLPAAGWVALQGMAGHSSQRVNLHNAQLRDDFYQQAAALHAERRQRLQHCGCQYVQLLAEAEQLESSLLQGGEA